MDTVMDAATGTVVGAVAVIGEEALVGGFALAGVLVRPADDPEAARAAWRGLPDGVSLVILSPAAAAAIGERGSGRLLVAVTP
jgi:vacuolar-type H+-ATPase subunit F/Vma7